MSLERPEEALAMAHPSAYLTVGAACLTGWLVVMLTFLAWALQPLHGSAFAVELGPIGFYCLIWKYMTVCYIISFAVWSVAYLMIPSRVAGRMNRYQVGLIGGCAFAAGVPLFVAHIDTTHLVYNSLYYAPFFFVGGACAFIILSRLRARVRSHLG